MSYNKYRSTQASTESPRQTEYRVFADVTRLLMECRDKNRYDVAFYSAIDKNRRLWLTLQMDLASDDNRFPDNLKAQLISLAIWVDKHSSRVLRGETTVESLIAVNRTVMEGLSAPPGTTPSDAGPVHA